MGSRQSPSTEPSLNPASPDCNIPATVCASSHVLQSTHGLLPAHPASFNQTSPVVISITVPSPGSHHLPSVESVPLHSKHDTVVVVVVIEEEEDDDDVEGIVVGVVVGVVVGTVVGTVEGDGRVVVDVVSVKGTM